MKNKNTVYICLNIALLVITSVLLVYYLAVNEGVEFVRIISAAMVVAGCLLNLTREKRNLPGIDYEVYEEAYEEVLEGAFTGNKRGYRKLLDAAVCFEGNKMTKAYKILEKLKKRCIHSKDYAAVYNMWGLCLVKEGKNEEAIKMYGKALQYDPVNALSWSNMGLEYAEMGKAKEAHLAYTNAIRYNPNDAHSHHNLAAYFVETVEPGKGLEHALKAISLNANLKDSMFVAAMTYQMLGDEENARKYSIMYGLNGGDANALKRALANL